MSVVPTALFLGAALAALLTIAFSLRRALPAVAALRHRLDAERDGVTIHVRSTQHGLWHRPLPKPHAKAPPKPLRRPADAPMAHEAA